MPRLEDFDTHDLLDALDCDNTEATKTAVNRFISHMLAIASQQFPGDATVERFLTSLTDVS